MQVFSNFRSIILYLRPYRREVIYAVIALLFSSSAVLLLSQNLRHIVDNGLSQGDPATLNMAVLKTILVVFILGIATACRFFFITYIGEKLVCDIRRKIQNKILTMSPSFFEVNKAGELLSQLSSDTTVIYNVISSSLSVMLRNLVMLIGGMILLILTSPKLTAIIMVTVPVIVLPIIILGRYTRKLARNSQDKVAELTSISEEVINNIKTIQAYSQEDFERQRFERKLDETVKMGLERIVSRSALTFLMITGIFSTIAFVLWIGSKDVINNVITPGQLSSFIFLTVLCAASMGALSEVINNIQKAYGVSERISEFLNKKPDIVDVENPLRISQIEIFDAAAHEAAHHITSIVFDNVTFFYPAKKNIPALKNFSATFPVGKTTALVGKSGAGKSTIFQLLLRFYNIQRGVITYNGIDISKMLLSDFRREFAYVSQDPAIFSATIYENIAYGDPSAPSERIYNAAEIAAATGFINALPQGFETFVGEKGVRLSGGQKQRIAIARAFLKNPNVLLLDEATSSLDMQNEHDVQQGIKRLTQNRTCIIIAHRLSTIQHANNIIVMHNGEICEQGMHDDLIKAGGYYKGLYSKISEI